MRHLALSPILLRKEKPTCSQVMSTEGGARSNEETSRQSHLRADLGSRLNVLKGGIVAL